MPLSSHLTDAMSWAAMTDEEALQHGVDRGESIGGAWATAEGRLFALLAEEMESRGEVHLANTYALAAERLAELSWRLGGPEPFCADHQQD